MTDPTSYRTLLQLSLHIGVGPWSITRNIRLGRIHADRPGGEWLFTPEQWEEAVEFYRRRGQPPAGEERRNDG